MLQTPTLLLQPPHTRTTDRDGWQRELPSRCRGLQMLAGESYRESRGRRAPMLPSGGTSSDLPPIFSPRIMRLSPVTPCPRSGVAFWMKMFNMNAIYQLCWTTLGAAFAPLAATPCDSRRNCEPKKAPSSEQQGRLPPQSSREGQRSQQGGNVNFRHQG